MKTLRLATAKLLSLWIKGFGFFAYYPHPPQIVLIFMASRSLDNLDVWMEILKHLEASLDDDDASVVKEKRKAALAVALLSAKLVDPGLDTLWKNMTTLVPVSYVINSWNGGTVRYLEYHDGQPPSWVSFFVPVECLASDAMSLASAPTDCGPKPSKSRRKIPNAHSTTPRVCCLEGTRTLAHHLHPASLKIRHSSGSQILTTPLYCTARPAVGECDHSHPFTAAYFDHAYGSMDDLPRNSPQLCHPIESTTRTD